jgi:lipopolysaccharide cholinephosphotransferase
MMSKFKSMMPVSSRSFHSFEQHVNRQLAAIKRQTRTKDDPKTPLRFWALYQRDGENLLDAKRRFFKSLPAAQGDAKLFQDAQAKLMREFHQMCVDNHLQYWVTGGVLIGAERTGGFIPWDDDVDVAIPRDDINKLKKILEGSTTHRVVTVWDYRGMCEQIRLRTADPDNPAFIDLFIFDWTNDPTEEMYWASHDYRKQMIEEMRKKYSATEWPKLWHVEDDDTNPLVQSIRADFNRWILKEREEAPYITDREHATGLYRTIENFDDPYHFAYVGSFEEDWYPAREMPFEDFTIWAPKNKEKYLDGVYGDIWELPNDINSHFTTHVSGKTLQEEQTREALKRYLAQ